MRRIIGLAVLLTVLIPLAPGRSMGQQKPASDDPVLQRLDVILARLTEIEKRLAKLERAQKASSAWWVDAAGTIWSKDGREIGFWGVDVLPVERRR